MLEAGRHGMLRRIALRLARPLFLAALLVLPIRPALEAAASTIVVNNLSDPIAPGFCTLYEAINNANTESNSLYPNCVAGTGVDTITFSLPGTITLTAVYWPVTIVHSLTIDGGGEAIAINGNLNQIFSVNAGAAFNLNNLTIGGGNETVPTCNPTAVGGPFTSGGAVCNLGTLSINNSTLSGNSAAANGGALYNAGALHVTNSTFYGNMATGGSGGAIYSNTGSMATVLNSTFSGNTATTAGASIDDASGPFTVSNSILDTPSSVGNCSGLSTINDGGYNIFATPSTHSGSSDPTCPNVATDVLASEGQLALDTTDGLAPNGGPTDTIALLPTSLAINAIPDLCPGTDQRGYPRPALGSAACDVGAYEFQTTLTVPDVPALPGAAFDVTAMLGPILPSQSPSAVCATTSPQIIFTFQGNVVAANANPTSGATPPTLFFAPTIGGTYELQASYAGAGPGNACGPAVGTALVTVPGPAAATPTSLSVASVTAASGSSFTAAATLTSSTSACSAGQPITFTLQSSPPVTSLPVTTGANGVATATFAAPSGSNGAIFLILASFAGNPSCGPSNGGNTLTLGPATTTTVTVTPVNETEPTPFSPVATVVSSLAGCVLTGNSVTFTLGTVPPQTLSTTIGAGGVTMMTATDFTVPSSGTFQIVASYGGSLVPLCAAASGSGTLTVTSPNATATALTVANVTAPEGATFTAAAGLVPGNCAVGQEIAFSFQNAQAFGTTNGSGVANVTLTAPSTPGTYPIQASFAGNSSCGAGSATGELTVPSPTPTTLTMPDVTARPATLFTAKANLGPASCAGGQNISFTFNGSTRTSFTNLSGQATTDYVAPGTTGPLQILASFAGTPYCAPISTTAMLHVQGATGPPILNVLPGSVSFGSDPIGGSSLQTITVANDATTAVNVSSITIASVPGTSGTPFTETNNCVPTVGPLSQCSISVSYAPTVAARQTASLQIHLGSTSSKTVPLSGTGIVVASAVPSRISYGSQKRGTTSNSSQVTVTNNLTGGLAIAAVSTSGDFVVTKNGCASVLKSRSSCKIKVAFEPSAPGTRKGSLTIIDTVSPVPLTVTLTGTGH